MGPFFEISVLLKYSLFCLMCRFLLEFSVNHRKNFPPVLKEKEKRERLEKEEEEVRGLPGLLIWWGFSLFLLAEETVNSSGCRENLAGGTDWNIWTFWRSPETARSLARCWKAGLWKALQEGSLSGSGFYLAFDGGQVWAILYSCLLGKTQRASLVVTLEHRTSWPESGTRSADKEWGWEQPGNTQLPAGAPIRMGLSQ